MPHERWRIAELAHSCGYCNGNGMTERCDIDGPDLRAAERLAPLFAEARREGAERAWDACIRAVERGKVAALEHRDLNPYRADKTSQNHHAS